MASLHKSLWSLQLAICPPLTLDSPGELVNNKQCPAAFSQCLDSGGLLEKLHIFEDTASFENFITLPLLTTQSCTFDMFFFFFAEGSKSQHSP